MITKSTRPKDAATLALIKQEKNQTSVLMGQRGKEQVFMPERYVFPGGAVETCDRYVHPSAELRKNVWSRLSRSCSPSRARALAAAAIRETYEETGLMLADPSITTTRKIQDEWQPFHAKGLAPALDKLDYIYRAVTPPRRTRRFNARFFMASANDLHGTITGNGELHDIAWVPLSEALEMPIPQITRIVLKEIERLLECSPTRNNVKKTPFFHRVGKKYILEME